MTRLTYTRSALSMTAKHRRLVGAPLVAAPTVVLLREKDFRFSNASLLTKSSIPRSYRRETGLFRSTSRRREGCTAWFLAVGSMTLLARSLHCHHTNMLDDCMLVVYSVLHSWLVLIDHSGYALVDYQNSHSCITGRPRAAIV